LNKSLSAELSHTGYPAILPSFSAGLRANVGEASCQAGQTLNVGNGDYAIDASADNDAVVARGDPLRTPRRSYVRTLMN
jgi:hypothetical protein